MTVKNGKQNYEIKRRVYVFGLQVIKLLRSKQNHDSTARTIFDQLIRSATSVGANIIEAQAASSRKDFTNFYSYALKSANESKFWLCLLRDSKIFTKENIIPLLDEADQLSKILGSSIITLKGKK